MSVCPAKNQEKPTSFLSDKAIYPSDGQDTIPLAAPKGKKTGYQRRRKKRKKRNGWMPNPYGRYPVSSALKKYLEATRHYYAPSTQKERARKTRYVCTILEELDVPNIPKNIKEEHILAFLDWMAEWGLQNETKRKLVRYLRDYLAFYGNDIIGTMQIRRQIRIPASSLNNIRSLTPNEIVIIHHSAKYLDGWTGSVARFITLAYPYTGLRPSELRTLRFQDIDIISWTLIVSHPKGEGRYGIKRRVGIPTPLRPAISNYLGERHYYLARYGYATTSEPLIPLIRKGQIRYWREQEFWQIKANLERLSGIKFKLKDYRSTFCQLLIDKGAKLEAVSKVMGHKNSKTTENYYGRIRDDDAISEIERAFTEPLSDIQLTRELKASQIKR